MTRRGLMGTMAALALAAFLGLRSGDVTAKTETKAGCACCGSSCSCPVCTCDAKTVAGRGCDCCGKAACCSAEV
jgi:hypothetical protein